MLPRWKCHKEVEAFKIDRIHVVTLDGVQMGTALYAADRSVGASVAPSYMQKHRPYEGGYYVRYADGYESFSPADAFEQGYTRVHTVTPDLAEK